MTKKYIFSSSPDGKRSTLRGKWHIDTSGLTTSILHCETFSRKLNGDSNESAHIASVNLDSVGTQQWEWHDKQRIPQPPNPWETMEKIDDALCHQHCT
jgi:hypothetical protein